MNHFEAHLMISSQKKRLQSTQDDNLVKVFWWGEKQNKMANVMLEILDVFPRNEF